MKENQGCQSVGVAFQSVHGLRAHRDFAKGVIVTFLTFYPNCGLSPSVPRMSSEKTLPPDPPDKTFPVRSDRAGSELCRVPQCHRSSVQTCKQAALPDSLSQETGFHFHQGSDSLLGMQRGLCLFAYKRAPESMFSSPHQHPKGVARPGVQI